MTGANRPQADSAFRQLQVFPDTVGCGLFSGARPPWSTQFADGPQLAAALALALALALEAHVFDLLARDFSGSVYMEFDLMR